MSGTAVREARVNLDAISGNVEVIRRTVGTPHFLAVVKTDAYGHGAAAGARAAVDGGADWLGVIDIPEAMVLRDAGLTAPILIWLYGPHESLDAANELGVDVGVSSLAELERAHSAGVRYVQLKVDTGLGRNGAPEWQWAEFLERAAARERAGGPVVRGIFSHLANAGIESDFEQTAAFDRALAVASAAGLRPELVHLAATQAAFRQADSRYSMVRVGLGCYGLSPFDDASSADLGLTPAMRVSAEIVSVKRVPAGSGVSYGHRYRTQRQTSLALIPLGYGDGIPRHASNLGPVSINGERFTVSGTIAMDQFVVDVGDATVVVGDRAVLFGDPAEGVPSATEWANAAGTINYEIITRLGPRIERRYVGGR